MPRAPDDPEDKGGIECAAALEESRKCESTPSELLSERPRIDQKGRENCRHDPNESASTSLERFDYLLASGCEQENLVPVIEDERSSRERRVHQQRDRAERRQADKNRYVPLDSVAPTEKSAQQSPDSSGPVDQPGHDNSRDARGIDRQNEEWIRNRGRAEQCVHLSGKQHNARAQPPGEAE